MICKNSRKKQLSKKEKVEEAVVEDVIKRDSRKVDNQKQYPQSRPQQLHHKILMMCRQGSKDMLTLCCLYVREQRQSRPKTKMKQFDRFQDDQSKTYCL